LAGKIYHRERYLEKVRPFYTSDLIKVITGIRRCGKSCLMLSVIEELMQSGVHAKDIIYLNLDKRGYRSVKTPERLEAEIECNLKDEDFKYLFIDEIQNVRGFEEVINGFREEGRFSIFVTGSNSYLLSGELVTKLTGRYIEIDMFTLSFSEYLEMKAFLGKATSDTNQEFNEYLLYGGFPQSLELDDVESKTTYIQNVVTQIVEKDIKGRRKIRNLDVFDRVMTYVINNYGSPTSLSNIVEYFKNVERVHIKRTTLANYIKLLENAKVIYKCPRFDMKSRRSLRSEEKYYLADLGIYYARNTDVRINHGSALENVLFIQLKTRGYAVSVGRIGKLECDFIVRKRKSYSYIQVSMTIVEKTVEDREYQPFSFIKDNYPQYLFTLDPLLQRRDGVTHLNLRSFLEEDGELSID